MKYLKQYETFGAKENYLKRGFMYGHVGEPLCFIGRNNDQEYPLLFLIFDDEEGFEFIEYASWLENEEDMRQLSETPTFKEFIIKNEIISKTLNSFKRPKFASGGMETSSETIKQFKKDFFDKELIERAKFEKDVKNYNL